MKQTLFTFLIFLFFHVDGLKAQSYPGVFFENSVLPLSYGNSNVHYEGKSWVKNIKRSLPLSDSVFFTPNNAVELNYVSADEGAWEADIYYPQNKAFLLGREMVLSLKVFVQSETSLDQLPGLEIIQLDSIKSALIPIKDYVQGYQQNMWLSIDVPLKDVSGLHFGKGVQAIRLVQNSRDGKEHLLYLDQIEILPHKVPQNVLTGAAVLSSVQAFEKHVDIVWQLPLTPNIRYIKIYRSVDNQHFDAVAIRPIYARRYSDIISKTDKVYYYKVAWVDYQYRESPFSEVKEAKPQRMTDEALLDMVQTASIKYFMDGEEFSSGMQLKSRAAQNAIVSVENTGVGVLALIVAIEKELIPKEQVLKRIEKIVSFLKQAESISGAFPKLLDGRTGRAIKNDESTPVYISLESTAVLMQGLLVARQYFNGENDAEEALRKNITEIWKAVEWNAFVKPQTYYLYTHWSKEKGFNGAVPLSGQSNLSLYMMAIASPNFNISLDAYANAATRPLVRKDSIADDSLQYPLNTYYNYSDSLVIPDSLKGNEYDEVAYKNDTTYYGIPLAVGNERTDLLPVMLGFMTFDPRNKHDNFTNYFENTINLIRVQHRAALENSYEDLSQHTDLVLKGTSPETSIFTPAKGVAIYPFCPSLAMRNIRNYYRNHAGLLWREYGFVRAIDFDRNRLIYPENGMENALIAVMIANAKSGLIWDLYKKDPDMAKVINDIYEQEEVPSK